MLSRPTSLLLVELHEERVVESIVSGAGPDDADSTEVGPTLDWDSPRLTGDPVVDEWELAIARGDDPDWE